MTIFEYIAVLVSIIIGLGITQLLSGVGRLISNPGTTRVYWVHLVWSFYIFLFMVFFWWWQFRLNTVEEWTFYLYMYVIFYAVLLYMLCVILFPREFPTDFREYFFVRRRWFFGLLIVSFVVDVGDTLLKGRDHFVSLGLQYVVAIIVFIALFAVAIISRNARFHATFAVGTCVYQVIWILRLFYTIS